jgi:hypothetical protein
MPVALPLNPRDLNMISRRTYLGAMLSSIALSPSLMAQGDPKQKKKLAIITTEWRFRSHAWHMGERFLGGYPVKGKWHHPAIDVVSAYVDQVPAGDLSKARALESNFKIYPTIAETLRCGTDKLSVDAVLIIGEHGDYPDNELGQKKYPRYEFFQKVVEVFKKDGSTTPIFNDKHLSWNWDWAKEMVDTSRKMKFPLLAGSSLPVTWRMPAVEMPENAQPEEVMCLAMGGVDSYDFHALEVMQCMAERRKGGETGVKAVQAIRGEEVWKRMASDSWEKGGWNPKLFEACMNRSQTLAQAPTYSHRKPTTKQMADWVKAPMAYRIEYLDGLKSTMLLMNGLVGDFTFAASLKDQAEPLSTLFYLPTNPNVSYSAALMSNAEEMFITGKAPYPVERTLLTSGILEACLGSLGNGQKRIETPHLKVAYQSGKSTFWRE